jgi:hypothetical protein
MSPAMVHCLAHSYLDMGQGLSLIPALVKWKIDLEDQICHGIIYFFCCTMIHAVLYDVVCVYTLLYRIMASNYGMQT